MSDTRPRLLLNPDSIQAHISQTGVKRGQGWRAVSRLPNWAFPSVVRFLTCRDQVGKTQILGTGFIIGVVNEDWLILCTASHVFEDIDRALELRISDSLSYLDTKEARLRRRYNPDMLKHVLCGVCIPKMGREILCPIVNVETSENTRRRDTALVFVRLPREAAGLATPIPIDIGPPPRMDISLYVAGFNGTRQNERIPVNSTTLLTPERRLILREGFLGGFGSYAAQTFDTVKILIPIDGGMSGGPVIIYRPSPFEVKRVAVAVVGGELQCSESRALDESIEGSGWATPIVALFGHEVFLPTNEWIPFKEAVDRKLISTFGSEVYHQ